MAFLMEQTMRWYGPQDSVKLSDIKQSGCTGVVTALHQIPVGDVWEVPDILERKKIIEAAGLTWTVIESLPVHEDIKKKRGNYKQYIEQYKQSLRNVASCGLKVVTYNFMPILDWMRTDPFYTLPDGSKALYFKRAAFMAFDLFLLKRPGAESDYTPEEFLEAQATLDGMSTQERDILFNNVLLGLPGSSERFTPEGILTALKTYEGIGPAELKEHLFHFLNEVVPVAEEEGLQMAIHPDDPPYSILGLPRIVSTEQDLQDIIDCHPAKANGLCFCTGSLGVRPDNDLGKMIEKFADRVHFLHLRSTKRDQEGNFFEADHLDGDVDMVEIIGKALQIMKRRKTSIPMRPDHGHQMLDDLQKDTYPGYTAIGRLRGLAELRGVERALAHSM